jgi:hypothetical protein
MKYRRVEADANDTRYSICAKCRFIYGHDDCKGNECQFIRDDKLISCSFIEEKEGGRQVKIIGKIIEDILFVCLCSLLMYIYFNHDAFSVWINK